MHSVKLLSLCICQMCSLSCFPLVTRVGSPWAFWGSSRRKVTCWDYTLSECSGTQSLTCSLLLVVHSKNHFLKPMPTGDLPGIMKWRFRARHFKMIWVSPMALAIEPVWEMATKKCLSVWDQKLMCEEVFHFSYM